MGRSRYGWRRNSPPFRAWGLLLGFFTVVLVLKGLWGSASLLAGILIFYLLVVRLTRCRVETTAHRPCRWRVRGLLGTCDYHVGYKRGLPMLVHGNGVLPMFMWPRVDFVHAGVRPDPQPTGAANPTSARARRPAYDWGMMALAVTGVLVAIAALIRDLVAG